MDMLSNILPVALFLALIYSNISARRKNVAESHGNNITRAPEPPGAWAFIGHLHLLGGKIPLPRTFGAMADKHGPIFSLRLGNRQQALVCSSQETIKECVTTIDRILASRPSLAIAKYMGYNNAVFSLAPYGQYWREIRKLVTLQLLTNHPLNKLKHVRTSEVECCSKELYSECAKNGNVPTKVNLSKFIEHLTFNISIRMLAGKRLSSSNEEKLWRFEGAVKRELYLCGVFVPSDAISSLEWLDIGGYLKAMKQAAKETDEVVTSWLEEHVERMKENDTVGGHADFMDVMLKTLPEDETIFGHKREDVIKATTMNLILTSSESTSVTIIWALSLLLNNPSKLQIALDELDAHVGRKRQVEESDINNLKYLEAIVKETLRLYPPGPLAGPREATEDCCIGKYHVTKGTRVILNLWKLHRDPRVWEEPLEFRPERFLEEHAHTNFTGQSFYIPFSSGRRMCPGMTFGLQVVRLTLATLLHGFDISTPMGMPVDMTEGLGIALPKVKPLEVLISPRLNSH